MFYIFLAIISGISIVVSRIINSNLAEEIGVLEGTFYNFLTGFILSCIFLLISNEFITLSHETFASTPFYLYLGGIIGVATISLSNFITPKTSSFYLTLLIFIGQLFMGILIDYITFSQLSTGKIIGGIFVIIGLAWNLYADNTM